LADILAIFRIGDFTSLAPDPHYRTDAYYQQLFDDYKNKLSENKEIVCDKDIIRSMGFYEKFRRGLNERGIV
jgi:hypothetical protein